MTNALHQSRTMHSPAFALATAKNSSRARLRSVRLYSAKTEPLFFWSGKAKSPVDAVALARVAYANAIEAIFRATVSMFTPKARRFSPVYLAPR